MPEWLQIALTSFTFTSNDLIDYIMLVDVKESYNISIFFTLPALKVFCMGRGPFIGVEWTETPWWRNFIWSLLDVIG